MKPDREEVLRTAISIGMLDRHHNIIGTLDGLNKLYALAYAAGARAEREKADQEIDELNEVHWRDAD